MNRKLQMFWNTGQTPSNNYSKITKHFCVPYFSAFFSHVQDHM